MGVILFYAAPLPVLGLTKFGSQRFSTVADHYVYLGMLGAALAAASLVAGFGNRLPGRAIVSAVFVGMGTFTFLQAGYWKTDFALTDHLQQVNPRSANAASHQNPPVT